MRLSASKNTKATRFRGACTRTGPDGTPTSGCKCRTGNPYRHTSEVQRLIGWLKQVFPQIVHWFDDPASVMVGSLLLRWPTLQALQKASRKVLLKFFSQHNCRSEELIRQRIEQIRQAVIATTDEALMQTGLLCIQNSIALLEIMRAGIRCSDDAGSRMGRPQLSV